ncbi:MAG TPA: ABC transporter ATP-binding protein [Chloroflexota bacterium]|nr:ABC transporter ATP-binding protein [Chloroflexota bacterium]
MIPVLSVRNLQMHLYTRWGITRAVDDISFDLHEGETLGIVGESGCGKSMTALTLMRLLPKPAARIIGGQVLLDGDDLLAKSEPEMRKIRGRKMAMILQDPQTSLNPVFSIETQLAEALELRQEQAAEPGFGAKLRARAVQALRMVNVADPERRLASYPHQLSGGMKQRVVGAMAIAPRPRVLIADEPTTALDVTIQLQYLNLLKRLQQQTGVSIIFITHDFGVVAKMCDRAAVFYAGRIVEQGTVRKLFSQPAHPYTQALMASVPRLEERVEKLYSIEGKPPALFDLPDGCRFAPRCPHAFDRCTETYPSDFEVEPNHAAACWLHDRPSPPAPLPCEGEGSDPGLAVRLPLSAPERGLGGEVR